MNEWALCYGKGLKLSQLTAADVVRFCKCLVVPYHSGRYVGKRRQVCWSWSRPVRGRPSFKLSPKVGVVRAARVSYVIFVGDIPVGLDVDHKCENPLCVNPYHLRLMDRAGNVARGNTSRKKRRRVVTRDQVRCPCEECDELVDLDATLEEAPF